MSPTREDVAKFDPDKETITSFREHVEIEAAAGEDGEGWVETTKEVIRLLQPRGLNGAEFFIYHGIKVCEHGKREQIEADMETDHHTKAHRKAGTAPAEMPKAEA